MTTPTREPDRLTLEAAAFFRSSGLPEGWEWVEMLSPVHLRLFAVELSDAMKASLMAGDSSDLRQVLDDWQATAELDGAPEIQAEIRHPKQLRPLTEFLSS